VYTESRGRFENDTEYRRFMAFWDWIAPNRFLFGVALAEVLPLSVRIGPQILSQEVVIQRAWDDPGGAEALAVRTYWQSSEVNLTIGQADAINNATQDQASRVGQYRNPDNVTLLDTTYRVESTMAQIVIPNTYRVSIEAQSGGQAVTNVVGVAAAPGQALEAAEAVQAAWKVATGPLARLTALYTLQGFRALDLSSTNGDIAFVSDSAAGGRGAGAKSTNAASALVKWNGGTRSRSSRGRMYFGPLMEVDIQTDGRTMETTAQAALVTAMGAFRTSLVSAGFPLVVISPTLMEAFPVTSHAVESIIATQRRRIRS
jgi:hypothetical protein